MKKIPFLLSTLVLSCPLLATTDPLIPPSMVTKKGGAVYIEPPMVTVPGGEFQMGGGKPYM